MSVYRLHQIIKEQAQKKNKEDKGLSQKALYELTWRQPKQIDLETLNKICVALGVTDMNELLKIVPDEDGAKEPTWLEKHLFHKK